MGGVVCEGVLLWRKASAGPEKVMGQVDSRALSIVASLRHLVPETQNDYVSVEKQVDGGGSIWAGHLLLIYYFFVSLEALKCRLSSNKAHEPLWIPVLGEGVQLAGLPCYPRCGLPRQHLRAAASLN